MRAYHKVIACECGNTEFTLTHFGKRIDPLTNYRGFCAYCTKCGKRKKLLCTA